MTVDVKAGWLVSQWCQRAMAFRSHLAPVLRTHRVSVSRVAGKWWLYKRVLRRVPPSLIAPSPLVWRKVYSLCHCLSGMIQGLLVWLALTSLGRWIQHGTSWGRWHWQADPTLITTSLFQFPTLLSIIAPLSHLFPYVSSLFSLALFLFSFSCFLLPLSFIYLFVFDYFFLFL